MKFGFNHITDDARRKLDELGVIYRREETTWCILTNTYDFEYERHVDIRDKYGLTDLGEFERRNEKRYRSQGVRAYHHPDGRYFYLIEDTIFTMEPTRWKDYTVSPPTIMESTIFDYKKNEQDTSIRDILLGRKPLVDRPI